MNIFVFYLRDEHLILNFESLIMRNNEELQLFVFAYLSLTDVSNLKPRALFDKTQQVRLMCQSARQKFKRKLTFKVLVCPRV